ncbi:unnamed protein product [Prorocentrum cordatum]|uniref:Dolichyl-diphosphooligosaccharide--protein glycosyltransferase subunit KCP2 n=1 Tax=Prorocentrum cordatum TaxID=2364126 RepID=A0ABN9VYW3_9DINO|nr:unnamed protein product [Polarella glacialis]
MTSSVGSLRPLLLGLCSAAAALALELVAAGGARRAALGALAGAAAAHVFSLALAVDYEEQRGQCLLAYASACAVPYGLAAGVLCCGALRGVRRAAAAGEDEGGQEDPPCG